MMNVGFMTKYKISVKVPKNPLPGTPRRDTYLVRAYEYPEEWEGLPAPELYSRLVDIRLKLRRMGEKDNDMIVFSFWPDVIMLKEIGDPMTVGRYLQLDRSELNARVIMAQGRQNTNYAINLYACHPFFLEGFSTMTNGENTAFVPIREFLESVAYPAIWGSSRIPRCSRISCTIPSSSSGLAWKPTSTLSPRCRPVISKNTRTAALLKNLKHACRRLIIDGPNCVIGCLPDHSLFMSQDRKKLRPGIVGGRPGAYAFSSELCAVWMPPFPIVTRARIFNPCIWTPPSWVRIARRYRYVARQTHYPLYTEP
jgi:glutamate synthase domain-containing protein 1